MIIIYACSFLTTYNTILACITVCLADILSIWFHIPHQRSSHGEKGTRCLALEAEQKQSEMLLQKCPSGRRWHPPRSLKHSERHPSRHPLHPSRGQRMHASELARQSVGENSLLLPKGGSSQWRSIASTQRGFHFYKENSSCDDDQRLNINEDHTVKVWL